MKLLTMLSKHLPVVVVITKARADHGFAGKVAELLPRASNVIRVRAIKELQDDGHLLAPMNLIELVEWTMDVIPEGQKNALAAAQKVALRLKKDRAHLIVASAATAAAGIGAMPIPFSDAYFLVPVQVSMLASITAAFGLPVNKAFLATLVSATMSGVGGTFAGRSLVANLLLLIPGAGVLLHGVISGTTAALFTLAFGEAHITAISFLLKENPEKNPSAEQIGLKLVEEMGRRSPFKKLSLGNNARSSARPRLVG
jgi:uncharacterized protein (DUF697 family)